MREQWMRDDGVARVEQHLDRVAELRGRIGTDEGEVTGHGTRPPQGDLTSGSARRRFCRAYAAQSRRCAPPPKTVKLPIPALDCGDRAIPTMTEKRSGKREPSAFASPSMWYASRGGDGPAGAGVRYAS